MLADYTFIGISVLFSVALPFIIMFLAFLVRPRKPNPLKSTTYECGVETIGPTWVQFKAQYYIYALVFVVFDIEVAFLLPWAVAYNQLGWFALLEAFLFVLILAVGLVWAWRKGALRWM
jgi:NADH-quinone oxidoreductase subunit A